MSVTGQLAADHAAHAAAVVAAPANAKVLAPMAFASLPDPTKMAGARAAVTDSGLTFATANFGATVTGSGTNFVPVISNGTAWKIG